MERKMLGAFSSHFLNVGYSKRYAQCLAIFHLVNPTDCRRMEKIVFYGWIRKIM
ncbi:MAG: hypothetical protein IPL26_06930 [Leptospiraceae bacterium]|nr:hypothetical protein [Leptospiraceae bacterium]